jgi:hypothetical protein
MALQLQQPGVASEHLSDLVIAKSIAQGVLCLAGIVEMSTSPLQTKATYGRGERVNGVVLRHTTGGACAVEISVVIAEKILLEAVSLCSEQSSALVGTPTLLRLADQIRVAVSHTAQALGWWGLTTVDVSIDDTR